MTGDRDDPASGTGEGATLRERLEEPIARATELTRKTLAWFPVRVWRHFLRHNGFLLAASISYQSLFAIFAVLYVAFAGVGLWLGGSPEAVTRLIDLVDHYVPGLIGTHGLVTPDQVEGIAADGAGTLAFTGAAAGVVAMWTATGFVTFARRAVRDIFDLPFDSRNYILLKARDFLAAVVFGLALVAGSVVGGATIGLLDGLLALLHVDGRSTWLHVLLKVLTVAVAFAINSAALAGLFRFLTGTSLPWRTIWPGSLLGGAGMALLQVGVGALVLYTPSNPLLATFSVLIGFLLWFRLIGIVMLVAAAWIAVTAADRDIPLQPATGPAGRGILDR
ncbi:YihY/virulence factor BrkB family protein [Microbacterium sp.]|uniref:YihY/virulence factor BrkB family protein n=1 Tax=Microbacterium sp. TaxID=51671 RepID=UPI0039E47AE5